MAKANRDQDIDWSTTTHRWAISVSNVHFVVITPWGGVFAGDGRSGDFDEWRPELWIGLRMKHPLKEGELIYKENYPLI